ncbi:hypothetical protein MLD38_032852 [Melastoma candidum]|uniref:Uncharacterized protein n=1 Tax=Melastoma candidum TaxID=119954 RepID=A0ACB9M509_9MYRT|nr:hypothetical protein MLD38_032852 [Melastoma candidum]
MITASDFYHVMTAVVPLYVAMILAYGSVKWWGIFTPLQCSGINRFVALFAVPLLSFHFIASNNPFAMNIRFLAADTLQKLVVLAALFLWNRITGYPSLDWTITFFSLSTLPNTLVMGIPLLKGMYGDFSGNLMVQIVVLQCIIWYTLMLFLFEYRGAKLLVAEQFPDASAGTVVAVHVDPDVVSLDGRLPLETETEVTGDGKLRVTVRRSNASRSDILSRKSFSHAGDGGFGFGSTTPRPSNLTNAEIYSLQSSRNPTPRGSSFTHADIYSMMAAPGGASRGPVPRLSNYEDDPHCAHVNNAKTSRFNPYPGPNPGMFSPKRALGSGVDPRRTSNGKLEEGRKDLHMFVWSSSASPVSDVYGNGGPAPEQPKEVRLAVSQGKVGAENPFPSTEPYLERNELSFVNRETETNLIENRTSTPAAAGEGKPKAVPPAGVMTRLILIMVWRKLIRNPNTYSSLIGITWALVSFRWDVKMPAILAGSISILSDAGLGMAMFSLGLFMALQPRIIACGNAVAAFAMAVRFLAGPAVMAAASAAVHLKGNLFRVAIVQAALPQGIVPFVFAKEYNVHPEILSTGVIFGMLIALPITLVYYILLGL